MLMRWKVLRIFALLAGLIFVSSQCGGSTYAGGGGDASTSGSGSNGSSGSGSSGVGDASSQAGTDAALADGGASPEGSAGSPDGSLGPCNVVPMGTRSPQVYLVNGDAPMRSGGAIRDGLYELESALVYVGMDGGASLQGRSHAISIAGQEWASVSSFGNSPTARHNDQVTLSGNSVSLKRVCGDPGQGSLFGTQGTYTASDSALVLNFAAGAAFWDGTAVLTFLRSSAADAGAGGYLGTPCSNSYACWLGDGGGPAVGIACGASGTCEACRTNGLNDPCLGRPASDPQGPDCCSGLRCVNQRCVL
jgi:hypothetical protein